MIRGDADTDRIRWITLGAALIIITGLLAAAWYAIQMATTPSQRSTRQSLPDGAGDRA